MVYSMEYREDGTAHGNINSLFGVISLVLEDGILLGSLVGYSVGSSKGYKYGNMYCGVDGEVKNGDLSSLIG